MGSDPLAAPVRRVLFICIGNSCRSQLAEAFSRRLAPDVIEPSSAGLSPFGRIAETTRTVGREMGLSFDGQTSKGFTAADLDQADLIVNLSGTEVALATETPVVDWDVEDPYGEDMAVHRRIASEIEARVILLAAKLRTGQSHSNVG